MSTLLQQSEKKSSKIDKAPPKKKGKGWLMKLIAWVHLWPSIISGLVIIFICLTGTLIVYCDELIDLSAGDAKYVKVEKKRINGQQLLAVIKAKDSTYAMSEVVFFKDPSRSVRIRLFDTKTKTLGFAYVNPYTGALLKVDHRPHFFFVTAHLHSEFLAGKVGGWIVAICTIVFLISCVTGLVLWWPKRWTKRTMQDSFTIKWKAKFKRFNYDLHNVYGFYSLIICVILSLTGLLIFFQPMGEAVNKIFGGGEKHLDESFPKVIESKNAIDFMDKGYALFNNEAKEKKTVAIWVFNLNKTAVYSYNLGKSGLKSTENFDLAIFNKYTGEKLVFKPAEIKHEKNENMIWQLHMGQWWGQIGKFSTFLAGVVSTSLSITGFLIWWGRRKKKKKLVKA